MVDDDSLAIGASAELVRAPRSAVVVLGMHRSGTSALARVLNLLGCKLPNTLLEANPTNENGHWEPQQILALNDQILASAGSSWDDWAEFNPRWLASPSADEFRGQAIEALKLEFGDSRLFVLKDPRICRLLPFWLQVLESAQTRPLLFLPLRNPLEVAASLQKRDGFDLELGYLLWLRNVLDAEFASRGMPRVFTSYDRLLNAWGRTLEDAQTTFGISWPRQSDKAAEEIEAFLSKRHRHHVEEPEKVVENPALSGWLRETFEILHGWVRTGERPLDFPALDDIRNAFNGAGPAFSRLIAGGRQAKNRSRQLEGALEEMRTKFRQVEPTAAERRVNIARLDLELAATRQRLAENDQLSSELAAARGQLSDKAQQAEVLETKLARGVLAANHAQTVLQEREKALGRAVEESARRRQTIDALRDELETQAESAKQAAAMLDESNDRLAAAQSALAQRRLEADEATAELESVRAELQSTIADRAEGEKIIAGFKEHITLLLADAEARASDTANLQRNLAAVQAERDAERATHAAELAAAKAERDETTAELAQANSERAGTERRLKERFAEIAMLTRLIDATEKEARGSEAETRRMRLDAAREMGHAVHALIDGRAWRLMPGRLRIRRQMALLKRSGLFDADWYVRHYDDVASDGVDPMLHYIVHGAREGREPNGILAGEARSAESKN